ncbi:MAG TPA: sirohydrochlorin chelatase, partial [Polyangiaceae bacterium]
MTLGILVVGHGSRDAAANREFEAFVAAYAERRGEGTVERAYVELAQPAVAEGLDAIAARSSRVIALPLFLFAASHVKNDLPLALDSARRRWPQVRFDAASALGVHPSMAQVAFARGSGTLPEDPAQRARTVAIVVGRGSSDPDANGDLFKLARLVGEGRGLAAVETTFLGITRPSVEETLEQVARARPERVVVLPYLLFAGRLVEKLDVQVAAFRERYPWIRISRAPHLGADERIFGLLDERVAQALDGSAPLPCDTCMYRTALPGFEAQVGGLKALLYSVRHTATHTQAMPHLHAHRLLRKHVLVCANADCADRG